MTTDSLPDDEYDPTPDELDRAGLGRLLNKAYGSARENIHKGEPADAEVTAMTAAPSPSQSMSILDMPPEQFKAGLTRRGDNRRLLFEWLKANMIRDVDYGKIHTWGKQKCPHGNQCTIASHWSKDTLFQPGAEKICGMLGLRITFPNLHKYEEAALAGVKIETVIIRCELLSSAGAIVGEGIGADSVQNNYGDLNKTLKMAAKSGLVMATIKTGGMSELFTLDLDHMYPEGKPGFTPEQRGQMQEDVKAGQANHAANAAFNVRDVAAGKTPAPAANGAQKQAQGQQSANGKPPANLPCPKCGEVCMGRSQFPPDKGLDPPDYSRRGFYCYACKFKAYSNDAGCIALEKQGPKPAVLFSDEQPDDTALVNDLAHTLRNCPNLKELASNWEIVNMHKNGQGLSKAAVSAKGVEYLLGIKEQRKKELTPKEEEAIPF